MKNTSSKSPMEALGNIKKVEVPEELYGKILQKIGERNRVSISPVWVKIAAAIVIGMLSTELFFVAKQSENRKEIALEKIVPLPNNNLYYE